MLKSILIIFTCLVISTNCFGIPPFVKSYFIEKASMNPKSATDENGNIIMIGRAEKEFKIKKNNKVSTYVINSPAADYINKYDSNNNLLWSVVFEDNSKGNNIRSLIVTKDGSIFTHACFHFKIKIIHSNKIDSVTCGPYDYFIIKIDPNGKVELIKRLPGLQIKDMVLQKDRLFATGYFDENVKVDKLELITNTYNNTFLLQLDKNGEAQNFHQLLWEGYNIVDFDMDEEDNFYYTGTTASNMSFKSKKKTISIEVNSETVYVLKLNTSLDPIFGFKLPEVDNIDVSGIKVSNKSFIIFGNQQVNGSSPIGNGRPYIYKYDLNGILQWNFKFVRIIGDNTEFKYERDEIQSLNIDSKGNIVAAYVGRPFISGLPNNQYMDIKENQIFTSYATIIYLTKDGKPFKEFPMKGLSNTKVLDINFTKSNETVVSCIISKIELKVKNNPTIIKSMDNMSFDALCLRLQ